MQNTERYKAEDLICFGRDVLVRTGFPEEASFTASRILVEADLRNIYSHGMAGGSSLDDIIAKKEEGGIATEEPILLNQRYPAIFNIDARGSLGHYVTDKACDLVIDRAREMGYAKAYIFNSSHFGIAGYYSEKIAENDLAGKVSCTSPVWTKPFIETGSYEKAKKRLGTNPIAWSIPYDGGIVTLDMATTQRAVSPAIKAAKENSAKLRKLKEEKGMDYISRLEEVQGEVAVGRGVYGDISTVLKKELGVELSQLPRQYLLNQNGEEVLFPLAFNDYFKKNFWIAPLGGTAFGYKGFILNLLVELDNVAGGGNPNPIPSGNQTEKGRVSHTIEAYCIDSLKPLAEVKKDLKIAIDNTLTAGGPDMWLPGEKEQEFKKDRTKNGIPYSSEQIEKLTKVGEQARVQFNLKPLEAKQ